MMVVRDRSTFDVRRSTFGVVGVSCQRLRDELCGQWAVANGQCKWSVVRNENSEFSVQWSVVSV